MSFVQIIEVKTKKLDELDALVDDLQARRDPKGRPTRAMVCRDRDRPGVVVTIVEFPSDEAVAASNADPVVNEMGERLAAITDGPPTFSNLDLHRVIE